MFCLEVFNNYIRIKIGGEYFINPTFTIASRKTCKELLRSSTQESESRSDDEYEEDKGNV